MKSKPPCDTVYVPQLLGKGRWNPWLVCVVTRKGVSGVSHMPSGCGDSRGPVVTFWRVTVRDTSFHPEPSALKRPVVCT